MIRGDKLLIFENFRVDRDLPKFQKRVRKVIDLDDVTSGSIQLAEDSNEDLTLMSEDTIRALQHISSRKWDDGDEYGPRLVPITAKKPWQQRLLSKLAVWKREPKEQPQLPSMTIPEFFTSLKNSASELEVLQERAMGYEKALANAEAAGQTALYEQLKAGLHAYWMESQLIALKLTKFLKEEDVVRFAGLTKRGLSLDWIKNFTRVIPSEIVATKKRLDELGVFDNYVVLHYDPEKKAVAETAKETEARKDPILFGVIENRRVLYFVGDWIDEYCDLTLDQLADVVGRETRGYNVIHTLADSPSSYREPTT